MIKKIIKLLLYLFISLALAAIYLSFFGIETKRFNKLITENINEKYKNVDVSLNKVKIVLDVKKIKFALETNEPSIKINNTSLRIKKIKTDFPLKSIFKNEFYLQNLIIISDKNQLKELLKILRVFHNTPQIFILNKLVRKGELTANIEAFFKGDGKTISNFKVNGSIKNANIRLFNKKEIQNINLDFVVNNGKYTIRNSQLEYSKLKLFSQEINIEDKRDYFLIRGNISNSSNKLDITTINTIFRKNFTENIFKDIKISSKNNFSFKLDKKFKISQLQIDSEVNLKSLDYQLKNDFLKDFFIEYDDSLHFTDHEININYKKDEFDIRGEGFLSVAKKKDKVSYNINSKKDKYNFSFENFFNNIPFKISALDFSKNENSPSKFKVSGLFQNKEYILREIFLSEGENIFKVKNLLLTKKSKIKKVDKIELNFVNDKKKENKIKIEREKTDYNLYGKIFDATSLVDQILNSSEESNFSGILDSFNSLIKVKIGKVYINKDDFLKILTADIKFNKSEIKNLNLKGNFEGNKNLNLSIKTNQNNEKITTLYSGSAPPLVKNYKFIKGFDEGYLDFYSIKSNNISKSNLKIMDFKLKEVPALTKILTLASLQGIADLLTGEGIRFNEFDMKFTNEKKLMSIEEIYAIGPAISILMDGYIQSDELVSLRGTLVPATTLNKVIGSIPFLGNILVGKKTGEGVFGVSFKIKGPPKDLKTTVNPIKTLTPRFITRTLEKINQSN